MSKPTAEHPAAVKVRETGREGVMRACLDLLEAERIRHWRMNAGKTVLRNSDGSRRVIRGHAKGTPDILAAPRLYAQTPAIKIFLWVECKAPGKRATPEQFQFADEARLNGEYWLLVDDAKQLVDWLKENRAR